ncbi:MAG: choice-of-anchor B family protein [Planctomycetota bacterium]
MRLHSVIALFVALAVAGTTAPLLAHSGDPKAQDRQPPFVGPGWNSATGNGATPFGPGPTFASSGVQLLSWMTLGTLSATATNTADCWGYVSPSGREYALVAHSDGMTIVDLTNPGAPVIVSTIPGPGSLWRDVKIFSRYAYVVTEGSGSGLQVIDLVDIDNGNTPLINTVATGGTSRTHNVAIDEFSGFLYRCGGGNGNLGLRIYDLANPTMPSYVTAWNGRYVHDAQVVTYTTGPYAGKQIAFCCGGLNNGNLNTGLTILDVTDKSNIVVLSEIVYPNGEYSHQGWLSEDRQYFFLNDELDEGNLSLPTKTFVFNVVSLTAPFLATTFTNNNPAIGHNLYTKGNLLYEANYRSGVRIFDVTNPLAAVEVAYFDTYPGSDSANFNGLWNVFPYFPSGIFIGSDFERGLFVWHLGTVSSDCNANNVDDALEITLGISEDCDGNGIPDSCDLLSGAPDLDGNGILDSCECTNPFIRGDSNGSATVEVGDAVHMLAYMFSAGPSPLPIDAADSNNDDVIDISDPVFILSYLFTGGAAPDEPFLTAGCE